MGRHHGGQRVGGSGGEYESESDSQTELPEILSYDFPHISYRYKDGQKRHGSRQNGKHEFFGGVFGCGKGILPHFHMAENVFHKDNGVVDEKAYCQ